MIKRIIGTLFTLATIGVVVFAALNYHNYRSIVFERSLYEMLFVRPATEETETVEEQVAAEEPVAEEIIIEDEPVMEPAEEATTEDESTL